MVLSLFSWVSKMPIRVRHFEPINFHSSFLPSYLSQAQTVLAQKFIAAVDFLFSLDCQFF